MAALFFSCANGTGDNGSSAASSEPLFSADDTTVAAASIELSDGNWVYKKVSTDSDGDSSITVKYFTVSENATKLVYTKITSSGNYSGTIPADATQEEIEEAKQAGYVISGNTYTYSGTKDYTSEELAEVNEHASVYEFPIQSQSRSSLKTNENKSKYTWTEEWSDEDYSETSKYYLMKTSGGNSNSSDSSTNNNGTNASDTEYTIVYGDETLETLNEKEFESFSEFLEERQDYTINGKTISLKTDGYTKYTVIKTLFEIYENPNSIDLSSCYIVVYDKDGDGNTDEEEDLVIMLPSKILNGFIQVTGVTPPDDYSINEQTKTITLTASGYQKGGAFIGSIMSADENDD
ncbi:MAG: hypothetical protein J5710_04180 [Treponema sp.]|nr:hypothetical protein [Treponema sp.]